MQTSDRTEVYEINGWVLRCQSPTDQKRNPRFMLLLHGRTGNENAMWVFTHNFPASYWLIAPRAPLESGSGYSWIGNTDAWPDLIEFSVPASSLMKAIDQWIARTGIPQPAIDVMGFSQGAAMAFALSAFYPERIRRVIALSGYMPLDNTYPGRYRALTNTSVFIAHGTKDTIVPMSMAEEAGQILSEVGARVTFCKSNTGHKLGVSCLRGLETFLQAE